MCCQIEPNVKRQVDIHGIAWQIATGLLAEYFKIHFLFQRQQFSYLHGWQTATGLINFTFTERLSPGFYYFHRKLQSLMAISIQVYYESIKLPKVISKEITPKVLVQKLGSTFIFITYCIKINLLNLF